MRLPWDLDSRACQDSCKRTAYSDWSRKAYTAALIPANDQINVLQVHFLPRSGLAVSIVQMWPNVGDFM